MILGRLEVFPVLLAMVAHGPLRLFHSRGALVRVTNAVEIRPGSVQSHDLEVIERALTRDGVEGVRLVDSDGATVEMPAELVGALKAIVEHLRAGHGVSVASLQAFHWCNS